MGSPAFETQEAGLQNTGTYIVEYNSHIAGQSNRNYSPLGGCPPRGECKFVAKVKPERKRHSGIRHDVTALLDFIFQENYVKVKVRFRDFSLQSRNVCSFGTHCKELGTSPKSRQSAAV